MSAFVHNGIPEQLEGLTLNRRFSLNTICWKEGREGGKGGGNKNICAYQTLVDIAETG